MSTEFTELIPGLPEEIALECLTQLHYTTHRFAAGACRRWRELLHSRDFYCHRKRSGFTRKAACLVQSLPVQFEPDGAKPAGPGRCGISFFDPVSGDWDWVDQVPKYPDGLPLFCRLVSSEGKLVAIGGWDPVSYDPVKDLFVYDFTTRTWTQGREMPSKRSFFAAAADGGRVFIAGGHDESKNALSSAWVYDIRDDEWTELARMGEERDECQGIIIGSGFWVISGYGTENQGSFKSSAEVYDFISGQWTRFEYAWVPNQSPRSCAGVDKGGKPFPWSELDQAVRVGSCGVDLGDRVLITESGYQEGPNGFYLLEMRGGERGKLVKIDVPDDFSGFVRSGCCVEI